MGRFIYTSFFSLLNNKQIKVPVTQFLLSNFNIYLRIVIIINLKAGYEIYYRYRHFDWVKQETLSNKSKFDENYAKEIDSGIEWKAVNCSTFAVRETASLGIIGEPRVPPLNPSESIVL